MLTDTFAEFTGELQASMKEILREHLDAVANKVVKALDKDGSEVLEWSEFKHYMHLFTKEQKEVMDIIRKAKASKY